MEINYFNLSGGVNQASTKTELGAMSGATLYWTDSMNVEIHKNKGIIRQQGNTVLLSLNEADKIIGLHEFELEGIYKLLIVTNSGKIYVYSNFNEQLILLNKVVSGKNIIFTNYLRGIFVTTESDEAFYIKNNNSYDIETCNLYDLDNNPLYPDCVSVYKGRIWCAKNSTIYYSALGTYDDFSSPNDAGYINDFHTDTADIIGMNTYKDYLAIYKKERVYLLSGSNPDDFAIIPFADKGAYSRKSIMNVDNKQYFLCNGIYALEQVGELNQIRLGSEISQKIQEEFERFDKTRLNQTIALHYASKHQMWFFFRYDKENYYHTVWINDYINHAWFKRYIPQNITTACVFNSYILTADNEGKVYIEDYGNSFNGQAIDFMWKSPFLSLSNVHHRKLIEEFYFVLDNEYENHFNFSVYKDYDSSFAEDEELIFTSRYNQLVWAGDDTLETESNSCWAVEGATGPVWAISTDAIEKAEICGSCYSIQLCVEGHNLDDNCAIIGLQFREIYNDD